MYVALYFVLTLTTAAADGDGAAADDGAAGGAAAGLVRDVAPLLLSTGAAALADAEPRVAEKAAHVLELLARLSAAAPRASVRAFLGGGAPAALVTLFSSADRAAVQRRVLGAPVAAARRPRRVQGGARPAPRARAEDARRRRRRLAGALRLATLTAGV